MPPEVSSCHPLVTPLIPLLPPVSQKTGLKQTLYHKCCQGALKMKLAINKKLIPILVFILSTASILRLLNITIVTTSPAPPALAPTLQYGCSSLSPFCRKNSSYADNDQSKNQSSSFPSDNILTGKELKFLSELLSSRAPCNLLVFGLEHQYSTLAALNEGGITIFLEDNLEKLSKNKISNNTRVYKMEYQTLARDAYKLLKHARKNQGCSPPINDMLQKSRCKLALRKLPAEVYELKWDILVVDGPCGHKPECPGRMAAIYTASVLARKGSMTHVVIHDVDRLIEKWFSWEFLCEKNLVSAKGKFWNFRIVGQYNSTKFCPI